MWSSYERVFVPSSGLRISASVRPPDACAQQRYECHSYRPGLAQGRLACVDVPPAAKRVGDLPKREILGLLTQIRGCLGD